MKLRSLVRCIALLPVIHYAAIAGDRSNIRGLGMARTISTASRATDAIGINPANIALQDVGRFTLSLAPTGCMTSSDLFSYDIYRNYFTGVPGPDGKRIARLLTQEDKNDILSQLPDLPTTRIGLESMIFGISFQHPVIGGIGFAVIEHVGATFTLSKDFFRMAAFGLEPSGSQYVFNGTGFSAWWYREYSVSYARKLPFKPRFVKDLYAGIGLKFLRGYGVFQSVRQNSSFGNYPDAVDIDQYALKGNTDFLTQRAGVDLFKENSDASFSFLPDPAGKGIGFDIGLSSEIKKGLRVAISVTDIGSLTWDKNVIESVGSENFDVRGIFGEMGDTLKNALKGKHNTIASFSTPLPTTLRIGATLQARDWKFLKFIPGNLLLAFDYTQGLNTSLGNTNKPRFSLGAEYRIIRFIPFRTGIAVGGGDKARWAFGTGFNSHYFSLDLATEHFGMFFIPKSFQMVSVALGMKIRI